MLYLFTGKIMGLSDFLGALLKIGGDLYSSSAHECAIGEVSRSDGGVGFYQNLFSCFLIPLRRKLSFFRFLPFNPSPRRYRSSVSKHRGEGIVPTAVTKLGILLSLPCHVVLRGVAHKSEQRRSWNTSRPFLLCLIEGSL